MKNECENCGGTGFVIQDHFDPADDFGHGQVELPCEECNPML